MVSHDHITDVKSDCVLPTHNIDLQITKKLVITEIQMS